jgi:hypothetical protein
MGLADSAKGKLRVKAALFDGSEMVGAWEVNSWIKGGPTGGSDQEMFDEAAKEIVNHLRGDF